MVYSIYRYGRNSYDYYDDGKTPTATHAGAPPVRAPRGMGATPEEAAWPLPAGAKKIGSGDLPRGRIASPSSLGQGVGAVGDLPSLPALGIAAGIAYLAWRALR